jgi:hypothetical protein
LPSAQSVSTVHLVRQAVAPQAYGAHAFVTATGQAAAEPVQADACVWRPPVHDAGTHTVPPLPGVNVHPLAGEQPSTVHPLLSLHGSAGPPVHVPPTQVSLVVQAFPSLHDVPFPFAGFEQTPVAATQAPGL